MGLRSVLADLLDVVVPQRRQRLQMDAARQQRVLAEYRNLATLPTQPCSGQPLRSLGAADLQRMFHDSQIAAEWQESDRTLRELQLPEMTGGVNPGDQRAIYYLMRGLRPQRMLEVGTHIGCSTVNLALASKRLGGFHLDTVDIRNVNDEVERPWSSAGSQYSPSALMQRIGCQDSVQFLVSPSLDFLRNSVQDEKYDFIFLDGDHSAKTVYQELPAALNRIRENGVILLHDYFPNLQPLWSNGSVIPGVFLACQRLKNEGAEFQILPLGELPWPTKLGSHVSSLALVTQGA